MEDRPVPEPAAARTRAGYLVGQTDGPVECFTVMCREYRFAARGGSVMNRLLMLGVCLLLAAAAWAAPVSMSLPVPGVV